MTDFLKIMGIAVFACLCALNIRRADKDISAAVLLCAGLMIVSFSLPCLKSCMEEFKKLTDKIKGFDFSLLFKMLSLTFMTEICVQLCKDAGAQGLAEKTELAGKMMLLSLMMPLFSRLLNTAAAMIP